MITRPELAKHVGPDDWPKRWESMSRIIADPNFDWSTFRRHKTLMKGIETSPSRLDYWLRQCEREGVPKKYMVDDPFGSPVCRQMEYGPVSASSAKNAWYAWQVAKRTDRYYRAGHHLEIGGGYGGLVRALSKMIDIGWVSLMDSPACLQIQSRYIEETSPRLRIVPPVDNGRRFDSVTNTMSFGEMSSAQVKLYFDIIQSQLREGGVFYTANRVRREVDFAAYPYDRHWRHEIDYMPNEGKPLMKNGYVHCYSVRDHQANSPHPINLLR